MGLSERPYMYEPRPRPPAWQAFLWWCLRHWVLVLILVGALIYAVIPQESDHPRPGYVKTGRQVTEQQCTDEGGTIVGDVCYGP